MSEMSSFVIFYKITKNFANGVVKKSKKMVA